MYDILLAVPTYETIATECYEGLWSLFSQDYVDITFKAVKGYDCARARNEIVKLFLDESENYTHLMMVDSDVILQKDLFTTDNSYLVSLLYEDCDVLLGWYPRKSDPNRTEIFMEGYDGYPAAARWNCKELSKWSREFIPIKGGGLGCAIISRRVLEKIEYPYFNYVTRNDGTYQSEDLYFCDKARNAGFKIWVCRDLGCDHVGKNIVKAFR